MKTIIEWIDILRNGPPSVEGWYEIMYEGVPSHARNAYFDGGEWLTKEFGDPLTFGGPARPFDAYRQLEDAQ